MGLRGSDPMALEMRMQGLSARPYAAAFLWERVQ
jgi:hypothetical protein